MHTWQAQGRRSHPATIPSATNVDDGARVQYSVVGPTRPPCHDKDVLTPAWGALDVSSTESPIVPYNARACSMYRCEWRWMARSGAQRVPNSVHEAESE